MLDLVKFRWQNGNGAWVGPDWEVVGSERDTAGVMSRVRIGRPSLQNVAIIDRIQIPEDIRQGGHSSLYKAYVCLYYNGDDMNGEEFVYAMRQLWEAGWKPEVVDGRVVNRLA